MNNPLDKLFKNKLTDHSIEPGEKTWARVSAGLTKKNSRIIWYRAAAALFIGGLAFALWYNAGETESPKPNTHLQTATGLERLWPYDVQVLIPDQSEADIFRTASASRPLLQIASNRFFRLKIRSAHSCPSGNLLLYRGSRPSILLSRTV